MDNNFKKMKSERGIVLIIVLIVVAILTTLVVDLIYFTQVDTEISANIRDEIKAHYIAESGVYIVAGTINKAKPLEELTGIAALFGNQSGDSEGHWTIKIPFIPVGDGVLSVTVIDERSKINLNALVSQATNQVDRQVLTELTELFRMLGVDNGKSSLFIASLINWLDRPLSGSRNDQDPSGAGAEFYAKLESPYQIKDGPLDSLEEIRLINGMDDEFFNKIKDYVTVYPADKKINFSTASKVVMKAALKGAAVSAVQGQESASPEDVEDDIAESIAEALIEGRKDDPVVDQRRVREIVRSTDPKLRISAGLSGVVLSSGKSDVFSVISIGSPGDVNELRSNGEKSTNRVIKAIIRKGGSGGSRGVNIISWKEQ